MGVADRPARTAERPRALLAGYAALTALSYVLVLAPDVYLALSAVIDLVIVVGIVRGSNVAWFFGLLRNGVTVLWWLLAATMFDVLSVAFVATSVASLVVLLTRPVRDHVRPERRAPRLFGSRGFRSD